MLESSRHPGPVLLYFSTTASAAFAADYGWDFLKLDPA